MRSVVFRPYQGRRKINSLVRRRDLWRSTLVSSASFRSHAPFGCVWPRAMEVVGFICVPCGSAILCRYVRSIPVSPWGHSFAILVRPGVHSGRFSFGPIPVVLSCLFSSFPVHPGGCQGRRSMFLQCHTGMSNALERCNGPQGATT